MDLETLEREASEALARHEDAVRKRESAIRKAVRSAEDNAKRFFGLLMDDEIARLLRDSSEKRTRYLAALERNNAEDDNAPCPIGTKVRRKKNVSHGYTPSYVEETGILALVTRETRLPANTATYSRPKVGSFIVRILKKDGTPGTRLDRFRVYYGGEPNWTPCDKSIKLNPKFIPAHKIIL